MIQTVSHLRVIGLARLIACSSVLLLGAMSSTTQAATQINIEEQRQMFHDASLALQRNQITTFNRLLKQLDGYPAQPYLEYDAFRRTVSSQKPQQVDLFLQRYADYPFAYHARGRWLDVLARRGDWINYLQFFDDRANTRLQCISFKARLQLGQFKGLADDIGKIWMRGYSQPSHCDAAFSYYLKSHDNPDAVVWARIEKAFTARRPALARYLGKKLDAKSRAIVETWYRAHQRPEQSLKQLADASDTERTRMIIAHAVDRLARKNSLQALASWNLIRDQFAFSPEQKRPINLRIALSAASQHKPEARTLLSNLEPEAMNDQAFLWLARIQLRSSDWAGLLNTINRMPEHLQTENEWQYWLSRSMEAEGQLSSSLSLLEQISGQEQLLRISRRRQAQARIPHRTGKCLQHRYRRGCVSRRQPAHAARTRTVLPRSPGRRQTRMVPGHAPPGPGSDQAGRYAGVELAMARQRHSHRRQDRASQRLPVALPDALQATGDAACRAAQTRSVADLRGDAT